MAELTAEVTADIARPPATVWSFISNPANMTKWVSGIEEAKSDGPLKKGSRFMVKYKYNMRVHDITFEVTDADPSKRLVYKTVQGPYPIVATSTITPQGNGSRLVYRQDAQSDSKSTAFTFMALGFAIRPLVKRNLRKDLERAKTAIESMK
jgi:uncharacterized protein YndB with AHSA1/START domain